MERIQKLKEFLQVNPDDSFVQHALALEYVKIGEDEQAKELFENAYDEHAHRLAELYKNVGK